MHPEHSLIALLLPGAVFCCLMFMDRAGRKPVVRVFDRTVPVWLTYVVVFLIGWLLLGALLAQSIRRGMKS